MNLYTRYHQKHCKLIDTAIEDFFNEKQDNAVYPVLKDTYLLLREYALRPGKRLRPLLFILSYEGYSKKAADTVVYTMAAILELMHCYLLIHDDIIDNADFRRGAPALHKMYPKNGENLALIGGDLLVFDLLSHLLKLPIKTAVLHSFVLKYSQCYRSTCVGQLLDLDAEGSCQFDSSIPYVIARHKTALYTFVYPIILGATLSEVASNDELEQIEKIFFDPGIAFQIRDDYIGIFSEQLQSGKSEASDLYERKLSSIIALTFELLSEKDRSDFKKVFILKEKSGKDIEHLRNMIRGSGALDKIEENLNTIKERFDSNSRLLALGSKESSIARELVGYLCSLSDFS